MRTSHFARWITAGLTALGALALAPVVLDAVLVAPHALFMGQNRRTGEVYLINQGETPEEVTVELRFGYPATDSTGQMVIVWPDPAGQPSAAEWLRAFPRQVRVGPRQRQLIRVLAQPPADLPDGEYWSRMIVTSRAVQPDMVQTLDSAVSAGITLELRTITSITYRKGTVRTGVRVSDFRAAQEGDSLIAWVTLGRDGNAAYLGSVTFEVRNEGDRTVSAWSTPLAVYRDLERRFALPIDSLPAGSYRLRLSLSTAREDIAAEHVLPAEPVERSLGFVKR